MSSFNSIEIIALIKIPTEIKAGYCSGAPFGISVCE